MALCFKGSLLKLSLQMVIPLLSKLILLMQNFPSTLRYPMSALLALIVLREMIHVLKDPKDLSVTNVMRGPNAPREMMSALKDQSVTREMRGLREMTRDLTALIVPREMRIAPRDLSVTNVMRGLSVPREMTRDPNVPMPLIDLRETKSALNVPRDQSVMSVMLRGLSVLKEMTRGLSVLMLLSNPSVKNVMTNAPSVLRDLNVTSVMLRGLSFLKDPNVTSVMLRGPSVLKDLSAKSVTTNAPSVLRDLSVRSVVLKHLLALSVMQDPSVKKGPNALSVLNVMKSQTMMNLMTMNLKAMNLTAMMPPRLPKMLMIPTMPRMTNLSLLAHVTRKEKLAASNS
jgi:hypothetical protein